MLPFKKLVFQRGLHNLKGAIPQFPRHCLITNCILNLFPHDRYPCLTIFFFFGRTAVLLNEGRCARTKAFCVYQRAEMNLPICLPMTDFSLCFLNQFCICEFVSCTICIALSRVTKLTMTPRENVVLVSVLLTNEYQ